MNLRLRHLYWKLAEENLDGLLVSSQPNISYLTGFASHDAYLLASPKGNIYFTDSRYTQAAGIGLKNTAAIERIDGSVFRIISSALKKLGLKSVGFEERNLSYGEYQNIKEKLGRAAALVPTHSLAEDLRQIKSREELQNLKKAVQITVNALNFIKNIILPGKKEIEVAAELEHFIRYQGASSAAFEIIVGSGANSSFPHHATSGKKLKSCEPVLIDIGVDYQGYKSDLTRVFFLGKIANRFKKIYDIVLTAQDKAIKQIRPGVSIDKVDKAARQYITQKGFGGFFGHNLGHGVGLEVHETPHISPKEKNIIMEGMVFTIEPAIYLPHKFGIRLEDMVLVTPKGCEVLSGSLYK